MVVKRQPTIAETFGAAVRRERETQGLSQQALADSMRDLGFGWRQTTAAKTEAAQRPVTIEEALTLALILGTTLDNLANTQAYSEGRQRAELVLLNARNEMAVARDRAMYFEGRAGEWRNRYEEVRANYERMMAELDEQGTATADTGERTNFEGLTDGQH